MSDSDGQAKEPAGLEGLPPLYSIAKGEVVSVQTYGAFVRLPGYKKEGVWKFTYLLRSLPNLHLGSQKVWEYAAYLAWIWSQKRELSSSWKVNSSLASLHGQALLSSSAIERCICVSSFFLNKCLNIWPPFSCTRRPGSCEWDVGLTGWERLRNRRYGWKGVD